jgi:hypothetical protein
MVVMCGATVRRCAARVQQEPFGALRSAQDFREGPAFRLWRDNRDERVHLAPVACAHLGTGPFVFGERRFL